MRLLVFFYKSVLTWHRKSIFASGAWQGNPRGNSFLERQSNNMCTYTVTRSNLAPE